MLKKVKDIIEELKKLPQDDVVCVRVWTASDVYENLMKLDDGMVSEPSHSETVKETMEQINIHDPIPIIFYGETV